MKKYKCCDTEALVMDWSSDTEEKHEPHPAVD